MGTIGRLTATAALMMAVSAAVPEQESEAARTAYFGAVAEHFNLPSSEISILGDWRLPADEIPVVLFVARRAGVSAEALAALRRSGQSWASLASRYQVSPHAFHVPLPPAASTGRLAAAYAQFRSLPTDRWGEVTLSDDDIVALVNIRIFSQSLEMSVSEVVERVGMTGSFVVLYSAIIREDLMDRD